MDVLRTQHPHQSLNLHGPCRDEHIGNVSAFHPAPGMARVSAGEIMESGGYYQRQPHPQHYVAHPLERSSVAQDLTPAVQQVDMDGAEYMLRRKTPNGTLAAGYDGNPTDLNAKPHAAKHFLMPSSYSTIWQGQRESDLDGYAERVLPPQLSRPYPAWIGEEPRQTHQLQYQGQYRSMESPFMNEAVVSQAQGVDSVLDQGMFLQHDPAFFNGHQVPTVLQPMWPPCIGFTPLDNNGPYGPYWPDGAYEPYRPAPFRDPQYYQQRVCDNFQGAAANIADNCSERESAQQHHHHHQHFGKRCNSGQKYLEQQPIKGLEPANRYRNEHELVNSRSQRWKTSPRPDTADLCREAEGKDEWGVSDLHYALHQMPSHPIQLGGNAQFKEKTLAWAHRVYLDLLATMHQSRRNESSGRHSAERHFPANVYPKPPRQPQFHAAMAIARDSTGNQNFGKSSLGQTPANSSALGKYQAPHDVHQPGDAPPNSLGLRPPSSIWNESWGSPHRISLQQSVSAHVGRNRPPQAFDYSGKNLYNTYKVEQSPATTALGALEMLSRLCAESDWQWTDGILLGGCLAYGLGDFARALRWYGRVLSCDPKYITCCVLGV